MANVTIKVHNAAMTVQRMKDRWNGQGAAMVADVIASDCNTYVRMQDGTLANSMRIEDGGKYITWNAAYAKRVYYTGTPLKNRNPLASLQWCEVAKGAHMAEWQAAAQKVMEG